MKPLNLALVVGLAVAVAGAHAQDSYLMALNANGSLAPGRRVMLFSDVDGSLINNNFINESSVSSGVWGGFVRHGIQAGNEIVVMDSQNINYHYDAAGNLIKEFGAGYLSNTRSLAYHDGILYVANANAISAQNILSNSILSFDLASGDFLGSFQTIHGTATSPWGIHIKDAAAGRFLVQQQNGEIHEWGFDGTHHGQFYAGSVTVGRQFTQSPFDGNYYVASSSSTASARGIAVVDQSGNQLAFHLVGFVPQGVHHLQNGNIFYTVSGTTATSGFYVYDMTMQTSTQIAVGSGQFVSRWVTPVQACYANCDGSTNEPVLNVEDFTCFINDFAQASQLTDPQQQIDSYANCDNSTEMPVLNVEDFICFINAFAAGCP